MGRARKAQEITLACLRNERFARFLAEFALIHLEIAAFGFRSTAVQAKVTMQEPQSSPPNGPASDESAPGATSASGSVEQQLADLQTRHTEVSDAYLRAKAESENTRRRADEEMSKARKYAVESFAESLLPVKDSLEATLAIKGAPPEQVLEGVHATLRQLAAALERNKVLEINPAAGTRFDPHQHQAISVVPAAQEANTVVAVLQKGYSSAERTLRPALVTVAGSTT